MVLALIGCQRLTAKKYTIVVEALMLLCHHIGTGDLCKIAIDDIRRVTSRLKDGTCTPYSLTMSCRRVLVA